MLVYASVCQCARARAHRVSHLSSAAGQCLPHASHGEWSAQPRAGYSCRLARVSQGGSAASAHLRAIVPRKPSISLGEITNPLGPLSGTSRFVVRCIATPRPRLRTCVCACGNDDSRPPQWRLGRPPLYKGYRERRLFAGTSAFGVIPTPKIYFHRGASAAPKSSSKDTWPSAEDAPDCESGAGTDESTDRRESVGGEHGDVCALRGGLVTRRRA